MQSMTRLQALLKPLAKSDVDRLAREHGAQRYGKGALTVWDQLLVMLHGQFVQAPSLRGALQTHELRRSTLSDGNRRAGSAAVLSQVLQGLIRPLDGCRDKRVLGATSLIDSTPLTLKGRGFDVWTLGTKTRRTQAQRGHILDDERIARRWRHPRSGKTWREPLVLVTNDFERTALEIGDLYRSRWQIELLFKWIKQHLAIRRTWGTNEHAAHLQIYAAFIAHVLLMLHQQASRSTTDLWVLLQRWRYGLFEPCEQALMPVCVPP